MRRVYQFLTRRGRVKWVAASEETAMAYGARWQWTPAGLVGNAEFWSHSGPTLRSMGVDAVFGWCDGCGKERLDVRSCGRDSAGDPDSPDFCTTCRMNERHRAFGHRCARRRVAVK